MYTWMPDVYLHTDIKVRAFKGKKRILKFKFGIYV